MALYLTYRPQSFDTLIGQDHISSILKPKVLNNDYAHSNFLFYGPRGTGKTSTARIFAKAINCLSPVDGNPCNACENCQAINAGKTIDMVEIDAASHTQVDNIREEIIDKAPYPPSHLKKKVYIIDEVHMLSKSAFNALLKIMEEPPSYLVFVLATTEIHKVPETIISRCQVFTFKKIPVAQLVTHLQNICHKEGFTYEENALVSIAKISDGCARDAIKYLDQVSILGNITQDNVSSFLGVASDQLIAGFLQACIQKDSNQAFAIVDTLHSSGIDIANFVKQALVYIEEHFQENPIGYINAAEILKRISYGLKNFPLPTILMKMEIYNGLGGDVQPTATPTTQQQVASPSIATSTPSQPEKIEAKKLPTEQETPTTTDIPTQAEIPTPTAPAAPMPSAQDTQDHTQPLEGTPAEATEPATTTSSISTPVGGSITVTDIINHSPDMKPSIKSMLTSSCILEEEGDKTTLYIFNKLQANLLQKPENFAPIEATYKTISGKSDGIHIVVTTKEEYFAQKL